MDNSLILTELDVTVSMTNTDTINNNIVSNFIIILYVRTFLRLFWEKAECRLYAYCGLLFDAEILFSHLFYVILVIKFFYDLYWMIKTISLNICFKIKYLDYRLMMTI